MELRFQGAWPWRESNSWGQAEQRSRRRLKVGRKKIAANLGNKQKRSSAKGKHFPQCWGRERGLGIFAEGSCPHRLSFPLSGLAFKHNPNTHESLPRIHAASLSSYRVSNNTTASYLFLKFSFDSSWVLLTSLINSVSWNFTLPGRAFLRHSWKRTKTGFLSGVGQDEPSGVVLVSSCTNHSVGF